MSDPPLLDLSLVPGWQSNRKKKLLPWISVVFNAGSEACMRCVSMVSSWCAVAMETPGGVGEAGRARNGIVPSSCTKTDAFKLMDRHVERYR